MDFQNQNEQSDKDADDPAANPYSTPVAAGAWHGSAYPVGNSSYVRQVKPLCICMSIQGVLEILTGLLFTGLGFVVPAIIMSQQAGPGGNPLPPGQQQAFQTMFSAIYGVMGGLVLIAGVLRVIAGWRGLYFRSYAFCIITLFVGLIDLTSFYCLPTSLGLCVWGCIVLFKPEVKQAFALGAQGQTPKEVEAAAWNGFRG